MFCWTIKIQSFDNQTSKFTRPLGNVSAPLRKHLQLKGSKLSLFYYPTRTGLLSFVVLKITMNDRKSIEEFPWDIDCDLLQYARELRKKGFTSTLPAWYLTEEDLHFLPDAVLVWFKGFGAVLPDSRNCSTTLDTVFASTHSLLPTSLYERSCASSITWFRKSLDSGTPCLKFLPNLFIVNAMCSVAKRWINQLRSFA